jgi:methylenetetrahydrofolate dehydrogenase (NADP+)/methenyltetrahydrofolate cyclohydrolase
LVQTLLLKGAAVRDRVFAELREKVAAAPRPPGLAVVLVGDDPASQVYVGHKEKGCETVGLHHVTHRLPATTSGAELLDLIAALNADPLIDGILIQLPLPAGIDQAAILRAVDPVKDVDGFHPENLGLLVAGQPCFVPCTPKGILRLLTHYEIPVAGRRVTIVGRSVIVGRPLALLLSLKREVGNATVTVCHSGTADLAAETRRADIVVAAMGAARFLGSDHLAAGATVIDVGINRVAAPERKRGYRLVGDVDAEAVDGHVGALTPVPGGVGPMTIAMLLENTYEAMARRQRPARPRPRETGRGEHAASSAAARTRRTRAFAKGDAPQPLRAGQTVAPGPAALDLRRGGRRRPPQATVDPRRSVAGRGRHRDAAHVLADPR